VANLTNESIHADQVLQIRRAGPLIRSVRDGGSLFRTKKTTILVPQQGLYIGASIETLRWHQKKRAAIENFALCPSSQFHFSCDIASIPNRHVTEGLPKVSTQLERANLRQKWSTVPRAGCSWRCVSAIDSNGRTMWIADAHRDDGKHYVVHADEKLTVFLELESVIRLADAEFGLAAKNYNVEASPHH
jgi:hypothetical protein